MAAASSRLGLGDGAFEVEVVAGPGYRLWAIDFAGRTPVTVAGSSEIDVRPGRQDLGVIMVADRLEDAPECEVDLSECRFTTYNLDVATGDRFVLSNFLEGCEGRVGVDFFFEYEAGETWNIDAFNSDGVVEILEADAEGGNHGDGEYRFQLVDGLGEELDHVTIRIRPRRQRRPSWRRCRTRGTRMRRAGAPHAGSRQRLPLQLPRLLLTPAFFRSLWAGGRPYGPA